jgi:hypothetical protein
MGTICLKELESSDTALLFFPLPSFNKGARQGAQKRGRD